VVFSHGWEPVRFSTLRSDSTACHLMRPGYKKSAKHNSAEDMVLRWHQVVSFRMSTWRHASTGGSKLSGPSDEHLEAHLDRGIQVVWAFRVSTLGAHLDRGIQVVRVSTWRHTQRGNPMPPSERAFGGAQRIKYESEVAKLVWSLSTLWGHCIKLRWHIIHNAPALDTHCACADRLVLGYIVHIERAHPNRHHTAVRSVL